jgi:endonuclease YncB( thermonuclease family)
MARKPSSPPPSTPVPVVKSSLFEAAARGDLALVQEWVTNGASVSDVDAEQMMPLHHAAMNGRIDVLLFLLLHQAPLEARDLYGYTPLHAAARQGQLGAVRALVEGGAAVRALDLEKLTAYDIASILQHGEVADYLALHGGGPIEEPAVAPVEMPPPLVLLTGGTFRAWTSYSGAQLEAEFVRTEFDVVQLRKRDQSLVRIRLDQLKPKDQQLIRQLSGRVPPRLVRTRDPQAAEPGQDSIGLRIGRNKAWTVLTDCKLLKRDANDGDSFHVRQEGKEYIFRLYYVDCAETSLAFPDRVNEQADYFHLDEKDTMHVGLSAKAFTEKVLAESSFAVVTKWEDARGNSRLPRYYGFVITPQGDLDELLAAEGLVRIYGMRVDDNLGGRKQSELKQLEQGAKREGAGAWGMEKMAGSRP